MHLKSLKWKLKYSSKISLLQNGLFKLRIRIAPFFLLLEKLDTVIPDLESKKFNDYSIELLNDKDILSIVELPERRISEQRLLNLLRSGCICLGVKKDGKIVSFTWFNFYECTFNGCRFKLKENEAYVFDTYTLIDYRGKSLAPFMRYQSYYELKKRGKIFLYSIVETSNKQALKLSKKLNARFVLLGLYINLFKKWDHSMLLKNFMREENILKGRNLC